MKSPGPGEAHGAAPKCGGRNRKGAPCGNSAGDKTDHPGSGNCHFHGGSSPNGKKHAMEEQARRAVETYGLPRDISPTDALLEEVRYSAGHVAWLRAKVAELESEDLVWGVTEETVHEGGEYPGTDTTRAAAVNVWLDLYFRERKHLLDLTKTAISVGIEERRVRLAEAQGALMNDVIRRILARLSLTSGQSALLPVVVPEELRRAAVMAASN
jgi:hypothetical protein